MRRETKNGMELMCRCVYLEACLKRFIYEQGKTRPVSRWGNTSWRSVRLYLKCVCYVDERPLLKFRWVWRLYFKVKRPSAKAMQTLLSRNPRKASNRNPYHKGKVAWRNNLPPAAIFYKSILSAMTNLRYHKHVLPYSISHCSPFRAMRFVGRNGQI
jgi:hypothetical protein